MSKFFHWIRYKKYIILVSILFFPTCEEETISENIPNKLISSFLNTEVNKDNIYNFKIQEVKDWYRK